MADHAAPTIPTQSADRRELRLAEAPAVLYTFELTDAAPVIIWMSGNVEDILGVSVRSGRGMGAVKRISYVEARPHKVLSFCW